MSIMNMAGRQAAGRTVHRARGEQGLSQAALAEKAGVDPATVSLLENGKGWPRVTKRAAIERALGWPTGRLDEIAGLAAAEDPFARIDAAVDESPIDDEDREAFRAFTNALRAARRRTGATA